MKSPYFEGTSALASIPTWFSALCLHSFTSFFRYFMINYNTPFELSCICIQERILFQFFTFPFKIEQRKRLKYLANEISLLWWPLHIFHMLYGLKNCKTRTCRIQYSVGRMVYRLRTWTWRPGEEIRIRLSLTHGIFWVLLLSNHQGVVVRMKWDNTGKVLSPGPGT